MDHDVHCASVHIVLGIAWKVWSTYDTTARVSTSVVCVNCMHYILSISCSERICVVHYSCRCS